MLAQVLLFVSLVEALDISYCSRDNTGSSFEQGKGLPKHHAEPKVDECYSAEQFSVQRSLSRYVQEQLRFRCHRGPELLVHGLCSGP
jgi:hypothetical protein